MKRGFFNNMLINAGKERLRVGIIVADPWAAMRSDDAVFV